MSGAPRRRRYPVTLLLHNILRILAADGCQIAITTETMDAAVKAAESLFAAFGIESGDDE